MQKPQADLKEHKIMKGMLPKNGVVTEEETSVCLNHNLIIEDISEKGANAIGYNKDEVIGKHSKELLGSLGYKEGRHIERIFQGECETASHSIIGGDGIIRDVNTKYEVFERDGEKYVKVLFEITDETEPFNCEESLLNGDDHEITEIMDNIRVDTHLGKMYLSDIMKDIIAGHNDIDRYKEGAISFTKYIDERLEQEEKHNPDSEVCDILKEVKECATTLSHRIK